VPVGAISVSTVTTDASIGASTGGGALELNGGLAADATQIVSVTTTAVGSTTGTDVAVGAATALTFAHHSVEAKTLRNLRASNVSFAAEGTSTTATTAIAGAKGAPDETVRPPLATVNGDIADQRGF